MNPFETFNMIELQLIEQVERLKNRNYTKEETQIIENRLLANIMSNSHKNNDINKAREQYSKIIDILEEYKNKRQIYAFFICHRCKIYQPYKSWYTIAS